MSQLTGIAWTDHTFNIAWGCHEVSPGCDHCYAKVLARRRGQSVWGPPRNTPRRVFGESHWREPLKWNRQAEKEGRRHRVFCSSMADVFEAHPTIDEEREKLWPLIRATPMLDWQLLTKRPERIARRLPADWGEGYPNAWLGTSVENQEWADRRIPVLLRVPAAVRFLSAEPLLGPLTFRWTMYAHEATRETYRQYLERQGYYGEYEGLSGVHWIIIGGESGPRYRPADADWITRLVTQCRDAGVATFVKQDSGLRPGQQGRISDEYFVQEFPDVLRGSPSPGRRR